MTNNKIVLTVLELRIVRVIDFLNVSFKQTICPVKKNSFRKNIVSSYIFL